MSNEKVLLRLKTARGQIDAVIKMIEDDECFGVIEGLYIDGLTYEEVAEKLKMDKRTVYRQRRRLIRRISVILYGDRAL